MNFWQTPKSLVNQPIQRYSTAKLNPILSKYTYIIREITILSAKFKGIVKLILPFWQVFLLEIGYY